MAVKPPAVHIGTTENDSHTFAHGGFTLSSDARANHTAIVGATGAGKSTLMRSMIAEDVNAGIGVTILDPHGQLVADVLENDIPQWRADDVIYFNPRDAARAIVLNLLDSPSPEFDDVVVDNAVGILKQLWPDAFKVGARMEDIFKNSFRALIEHPSPTSLWNLPRLLTDDVYRAVIMRKVRNPSVKSFFENEFNRWTPAFREEAISPVLNKTRPFLADTYMRAVIAPAHSTIRPRDVIDRNKILLCNLDKGNFGADNARLLGSLIAIQEKIAALSRNDMAEDDRPYHVLYVEEAHNFIADFETILSETRKYHLVLVIATQTIEQLPEKAVAGIFGNAAALIALRVQATDAERLSMEFTTPQLMLTAAEVHDLPNYECYVRTLVPNKDGKPAPSRAVRVTIYPPLPKVRDAATSARVIRASNERWTKPRTTLDHNLTRFLNRSFTAREKQNVVVHNGRHHQQKPYLGKRPIS